MARGVLLCAQRGSCLRIAWKKQGKMASEGGESMKKGDLRLGGWLLMGSMAVTIVLVVLEGDWKQAIPLHLCSISALFALRLCFCCNRTALDFLWYIGMPAALLALIFPAPALSRWQTLLNVSYYTTHVMIICIPVLRIMAGMRVRGGRAPQMLMILICAALAAFFVNRMLGTDFMFLMSPPSGTPLEAVFQAGYPLYILTLMLLVLLAAAIMERLEYALTRYAFARAGK